MRISLAAGLRLDPLGELEHSLRGSDPLATIGGCLFLKGREGEKRRKGERGKGREIGREGEGREGWKGKDELHPTLLGPGKMRYGGCVLPTGDGGGVCSTLPRKLKKIDFVAQKASFGAFLGSVAPCPEN